jgi:dihydroneopterin aldolase
MTLPHNSGDEIHVRELELSAHIGVPDEERATPQRLTVSIVMWPIVGFQGWATT